MEIDAETRERRKVLYLDLCVSASDSAANVMTTVFIISAPSGSGKSTLVARLLAACRG